MPQAYVVYLRPAEPLLFAVDGADDPSDSTERLHNVEQGGISDEGSGEREQIEGKVLYFIR